MLDPTGSSSREATLLRAGSPLEPLPPMGWHPGSAGQERAAESGWAADVGHRAGALADQAPQLRPTASAPSRRTGALRHHRPHGQRSLEVPANIDALAANLCIGNVLEPVRTFRFIEAAAGMRVAYRIGNRHRESLRTGYPVRLSTDEGAGLRRHRSRFLFRDDLICLSGLPGQAPIPSNGAIGLLLGGAG